MTDWMNDLENELAGLTPRQSSRDLIAAALCAHRDSTVLTAKRLSRELTADELETAFEALDEKYPGLISESPTDGTSMAVAFVQTPTESTTTQRSVQTQTSRSNVGWIGRLTMVAALMLCFAGGIAIGLRSGGGTGETIVEAKAAAPENIVEANKPEPSAVIVENEVLSDEPATEVVAPRRPIRRVPYGPPRSSLTDLAREYHRNRSMAGMQASL